MLCIPLWKGYFKIRGAKEDPIPYVIKMELTYIPVKCGIINPDVNRFLINLVRSSIRNVQHSP